jgi:serine/threonine protein kinase
MEYIEGGTLKQYLEKNKIINEAKVKEIIFYILKAIEHLHKNSIIHRDIKLDNIMLENENNLSSLKIIDFGLSIRFNNNNNNENNNFCGTILYMSPELLDKKNIHKNYNDKERDIWAVGIIMYQLLYNKHPFHNKGESMKIYKEKLKNYVLNKNLIFYDEINKINRNGKKFILQLLEPDWTKRINANYALKKSYFEKYNKCNYLFDMNFMRSSVMEDKKKILKKGKELLLAMIFLKNYNNNSNLIINRKNSSKTMNTSITTNDNSYIFINRKNSIKKGFSFNNNNNNNKIIAKNKIKYYLNNKNNLFIDNNNNNNKIFTNIFNKKSSKNNKIKIKLETARNPTKIINTVLKNKKNNNYKNEIENNNICNFHNYQNNSFNKSLNIISSTSNNFYKNKNNNNNIPLNIQTLSNLENKTKYSKNYSNKNIMNYKNKKYYLSNKTEKNKKVVSLIKHKSNKKIEKIIFPIIFQ